MKELVIEETSLSTYNFINKYIDVEIEETLLVSTTNSFNIEYPFQTYKNIVNLHRINDIVDITSFLEVVINKLENGGLFYCFVETYAMRRKRILSKFPFLVNWIFCFMDYIFNRVFQKHKGFRNLNYLFTDKKFRVITETEVFEYLHSCGFETVSESDLDGKLSLIMRKKKIL